MISLSSHVLDLDAGQPAADMDLALDCPDGRQLSATTDADGRCRFDADLTTGVYRLTFATGAWYAARASSCFYPEVAVYFDAATERHYHVPLLINRHGYSTYRGS